MLIEVDDDFDDDANISNDANINDDDAEHCMLIEVDTCIHSHFPPLPECLPDPDLFQDF